MGWKPAASQPIPLARGSRPRGFAQKGGELENEKEEEGEGDEGEWAGLDAALAEYEESLDEVEGGGEPNTGGDAADRGDDRTRR